MSDIKLIPEDYIVEKSLPFFWCSGCGNGIILRTIAAAFAELKLNKKDVVVVTGIGCWGKADDYLNTNALHVTHGRALSFATGIKASNPDLHVVVLMGDGDCATIGGNHFIHAARRNLDVTAIVSNNYNYGMTGGQYSATTPQSSKTSTSIYGSIEQAFDLCKLAEAAGATYVARSTVYHVQQLKKIIVSSIENRGFSFVDVINICPTHYGRNNEKNNAPAMMRWLKEASKVYKTGELPEFDGRNNIPIGVFVYKQKPDFSTLYCDVQKKAKKNSEQKLTVDSK